MIKLNFEAQSRSSFECLRKQLCSKFRLPEPGPIIGISLLSDRIDFTPRSLDIVTRHLKEIARTASPYEMSFGDPFKYPGESFYSLLARRASKIKYDLQSSDYAVMREALRVSLGDVKVLRVAEFRRKGDNTHLPVFHAMKLAKSTNDPRPRIGVLTHLLDGTANDILHHLMQSNAGKSLDPLVANGFTIATFPLKSEQDAGIPKGPDIQIPFLGPKRLSSAERSSNPTN